LISFGGEQVAIKRIVEVAEEGTRAALRMFPGDVVLIKLRSAPKTLLVTLSFGSVTEIVSSAALRAVVLS
jgi:hypothetical protein